MFVNHGWKPSEWAKMPLKERALMFHFMEKEIKSRKEMETNIRN